MQPLTDTLPSRSYVFALTAMLWCARFAAITANALFDYGWSAQAAALTLEAGLTSLIGASLCLVMEQVMRRARFPAPGAHMSALFLMSSAAAIIWLIAGRLGATPLANALLPRPSDAPGDTATTITFIFFAWAGGWFTVAYAEQLRETTARADNAAERIVELEALLGDAQEGRESGVVSELWVPTRTGMARLPATDIVILSAEREYVRLRTSQGAEHLVRASLRGLHARLDPALFVQAHRSMVINVSQMAAIERRASRGLEIIMRDGSRVPVGRNYEAAVRDLAARVRTAAK
jgi:hypothetical protein